MIVLDASAVVELLAGRGPLPALDERVLGAESLHAPHLIDTEVQQALRGLVRGHKLSADRAQDALYDLDDLNILRYPAHPLARSVWALRENLTAYDATYVVLAEALGCPLVTCDARLARARAGVQIEVFARAG